MAFSKLPMQPPVTEEYNHVYFSLEKGLILYTAPGVDDQAFKNSFKSFQKQVENLSEQLDEILQTELQLQSKNVLLWSRLETTHPVNQLLNLQSFLGANQRVGYGEKQKSAYAIKGETISIQSLSATLAKVAGCQYEAAHRVLQIINASKENYFSSDIQSITDNYGMENQQYKPGILKISTFADLVNLLREELTPILNNYNQHQTAPAPTP